jgi:LuxR family maltose regulon positive regulatory protein
VATMARMPSRPLAALPPRPPASREVAAPDPVDTAEDRSLSFAPPDRPIGQGLQIEPSIEAPGRIRASDARPRTGRPRLIVEGGRPAKATASRASRSPAISNRASTGGPLGAMPEFPVQISKVQPPPLRDETLARDRLLDWLSVKIHRRVVLLTAEAGYGKTTLLADFTRRTRLRVLWFRLDPGDRDWTSFIAHLVAAIRIHQPDFGVATRSLLMPDTAAAPHPLEVVLETFLRELGTLPEEPSAFVFDDFHLVEDSADVRQIVREVLTRGPERMSLVFASRREPPIRLARLRALGELAELGTNDLRFDAMETERLFRETYEMRLEPSVLAELRRRTEGWAASLQLVRSALHDRDASGVRSFIASLSGAEGHLYEYLAEEVIGELPQDLQQFLMRTSVLETVDLQLGPVAAGASTDETIRLIELGERHGLFGRGGKRSLHVARAHPLVREFLEARLVRAIGIDAVGEIHRAIGAAAEPFDWELSARHFLSGAARDEAARVLGAALDHVLASGRYSAAHDLAADLMNTELPVVAGLVLRARLAVQAGDHGVGLQLAQQAYEADPSSNGALLTLVLARHVSGDVKGALETSRLLSRIGAPSLARFGGGYVSAMTASLTGSLSDAERELTALADGLRRESEQHFLGVALLNASLVQLAQGKGVSALTSADESVDLLSAASAGVELVSARLARAATLAMLGRLDEARIEVDRAKRETNATQAIEVAGETGWIEAMFGDGPSVRGYVEEQTRHVNIEDDGGEQGAFARGLLSITDGDLANAEREFAQLRMGRPTTTMAFEAQRHLAHGLTQALSGNASSAHSAIARGTEIASRQGAALWADYGSLLSALLGDRTRSAALLRSSRHRPVVISMLAEVVAANLGKLTSEAFETVLNEARARPHRWRASMRRVLLADDAEARLRAATVLEEIGEGDDIARLREAGKTIRGRSGSRLGFALARRLAPHVFVQDLGRVRISVGAEVIDGPAVRRKVLALLCLLLTRSGFVLTRDEVLESLWQDHDPGSALNSLNQTVYFLRRVFEPSYAEDLSPGYVGQDGETIWLDAELVDSTSRRCLELIRSMASEPTADEAVRLATTYTGRFALDFAYEEWAEAYRESLHTSYLRVVERAIQLDINAGQIERATFLAERAADVEPESEEIQLALARLYRQAGAHAAAAEQYARYSKTATDLGVDPQPL